MPAPPTSSSAWSSGVRVEDLDRATPCGPWTLRELLAHMTGQDAGFAAATASEAGVDAYRPGPATPQAHREAAAALVRAFATADPDRDVWLAEFGRRVPLASAVGFHLLDTLVHGWDVAVAVATRCTTTTNSPPRALAARRGRARRSGARRAGRGVRPRGTGRPRRDRLGMHPRPLPGVTRRWTVPVVPSCRCTSAGTARCVTRSFSTAAIVQQPTQLPALSLPAMEHSTVPPHRCLRRALRMSALGDVARRSPAIASPGSPRGDQRRSPTRPHRVLRRAVAHRRAPPPWPSTRPGG